MAVSVIREMYENRIADLKEQHQSHISDLKEAKIKHGKTYKMIITILSAIVGILFLLFMVYFAMDFSNTDWGIFFRN